MQASWLVLLPPLLVIMLSAATRRVLASLITGCLVAALIAQNYSLTAATQTIIQRLWDVTELGLLSSWSTFWQASYFFICLFLIILGILVAVISASGAAFAYGNFIKKKLKQSKNVELSTVLMSHLFFVDDYFNSLTVGSVMRPIMDQFKIPRVKLGLLINTLAAPLAIMVPVSSWVADAVMQLRQCGVTTAQISGVLIHADPFMIFLSSIPFIFYAFIQVFSLWYFVGRGLSFGILRRHEREAATTGNLFGGKLPLMERSVVLVQGRQVPVLFDFLLPLGLLFGSVIIGISLYGFGKMQLILCTSSLVATSASSCYFVLRGLLTIRELPGLIREGFMSMAPSVLVLIALWTFSALLKNDLATGHYLAWLLLGKINMVLLPAMFFIVGSIISSMMGSAWGAIAILISIALPMLTSLVQAQLPLDPSQAPMLLPLIGAVISGALVANHFSPVADILLMSSASSGSYHLDLIKAQITYCLSGLFVAIGTFVVAGMMIESYGALVTASTCLAGGIALNCLLLQCLSSLDKR